VGGKPRLASAEDKGAQLGGTAGVQAGEGSDSLAAQSVSAVGGSEETAYSFLI
jgi:hypothetical protein